MTGIIPAAGRGERMQSLTGGRAKELLPLGREKVLGRLVREALDAGADRVIVVGAPTKPEIDAFVRSLDDPAVTMAWQDRQVGLADAVARAECRDDALILLGDVAFHGGSPLARMADLLARGLDGAIAVEPVPEERVGRYGIVELDEGNGGIRRILEKPSPDETSSRWAVAGRYALSAPLMAALAEYLVGSPDRDRAGELNLTAFLNHAIARGADLKAVALQPGQQRVDCGSPEEYTAARWLDWE